MTILNDRINMMIVYNNEKEESKRKQEMKEKKIKVMKFDSKLCLVL